MYHISHNEVEDAIIGSSNFPFKGLGLGTSGNNIDSQNNSEYQRVKMDYYDIALKDRFNRLKQD